MAHIIPFKGILYNQEKVKDIKRVFTPPYDVISAEEKARYYKEHPYNIIRIILGKTLKGDDDTHNQYARAANFFQDWLKMGVLKRDKTPSIYIYGQEYLHKEVKKERYGFIALLRMEDRDKDLVLPHETTFSAPREDRLRLMREVKANLSSIFSLFLDPQGEVDRILESYAKQEGPIIDVEIDGVGHKLWRLSNTAPMDKIKTFMEDKQIFIADGHHRYEAAVDLRNEMCKGKMGVEESPYNYVMMYFTSLDGQGLTILPTHRVVRNVPNFNREEIEKRITRYFEIERFSLKEEVFSVMGKGAEEERLFGMYSKNSNFNLLRLKDEKLLDNVIEPNISLQSRKLDVVIFQEVLLGQVLKMKGKCREENIEFTRDAEYAIELVNQGNYQIAFFLNPIRVKQVRDIARAGERMPQKSTHFYPKLLTGLVMNTLDSTSLGFLKGKD